MAKKLWRDLTRGKDFYPISSETHSKKLGEYYFVFDEIRVRTGKDQALITSFDKNGIPLNKTYIDVESDHLVYFPISIGQMGLSVFHTYLITKSDDDFNRFLKFADWFKNNAQLDDALGARWLTDVPLPAYNNPGPWQSAFAQSRGISILLRAYQSTGKTDYLGLAEKALIPFTIPVKDGGVASFMDWGPFYEEYTTDVPVLVFNGHIFSMFGIHDFLRVFPNHDTAQSIFNGGFETLIECLPIFDLGYWTRYNYCQAEFYPDVDPATLSYQRLHIMLLKIMNKICPSSEIDNRIRKWNEQVGVINYFKSGYQKYKTLKQLNRI